MARIITVIEMFRLFRAAREVGERVVERADLLLVL